MCNIALFINCGNIHVDDKQNQIKPHILKRGQNLIPKHLLLSIKKYKANSVYV